MADLPPLPEPYTVEEGAFDDLELFTGRQLRGFAEEAVRLEREAAARECERMVSVSAVSYETGSACAAAIRSRTAVPAKE